MAYSREHMKDWLATASVHVKKLTDQLVTEIKLGTAEEWTAYELMRAAERELALAAAYLGAPVPDAFLEELAPGFSDGPPEPDEDREHHEKVRRFKSSMLGEDGSMVLGLDDEPERELPSPPWGFDDDGEK